jgi:hypothetical protein
LSGLWCYSTKQDIEISTNLRFCEAAGRGSS